ncbi:putative AHA1 activator of heat shock 90 protein [Naja naja]|uniref:Activator of 90 kDa heat shock protein ATPase homolog 1 n=1 Tax=Naja naja TaxID=35670 RepID=A0A8C6V4Q9_NAJNA|nr:putative AHA1 activator of heat shock 90 protein [Naja naja]
MEVRRGEEGGRKETRPVTEVGRRRGTGASSSFQRGEEQEELSIGLDGSGRGGGGSCFFGVPMAKWGEGDPRWIVEQRADATNVNNWHWTERDASSWSSEKLKALFLTVRVENEEGTCEVTEVSKLDGEASINNRKGKLIFFYEWNIKLSWKGTSKTGVIYKGHVEIPNLSDENDMDDIEINVGLAKDEPDTNLLYLMKQEGAKQISNAMETYISTLKTEFTQGMILPTVNGEQSESQNHPVHKADKYKINEQVAGNSSASKSVGVKIPTCKINLKDIFLTSPEDLYRVFITQEMVQAFTHSSAVVEGDKGGKFQLLNGSVTGEFIELVSAKQIAMKWRFKSWPEGHFATIVLTFIDKGNETEVCLEGKGIPASEEERTKEGWQRYYFEGIKQTFGYGARLF